MKITLQQLQNAINNSKSMREAASKLPINFKTFKTYAIKYNLYRPNQQGQGINKQRPMIDLDQILVGHHPSYHTYKLKHRLIKERQWRQQCTNCKRLNWQGKPIPLELDHVDGNPYNHKENNLRFLCPNCHAQTDTYRNKTRN